MNDMVVVGEHMGQPVVLPQTIPNATINTCTILNETIRTHAGLMQWSTCIICGNGIYELENKVMKKSHYGPVCRGWILRRLEDGSLERTTDDYQIVVKKYCCRKVRENSCPDDAMQEFAALEFIGEHPNVCGFIGCFTDGHHYYSIMPFYNGNELIALVMDNRTLEEAACKELFLQLLNGLEYLQSRGIFHRDLSLENIVCTEDNRIVIIDYGMVLCIPQNINTGGAHLIPSPVPRGKKNYMAPEVLAYNEPYDGFRSDIWSVGIILFVMLTKKFPLTKASPLCKFYRHIRDGRLARMCQHWNMGLSADAEDLLCRLLSADPSRRPTIAEIRAHPWLAG